nr:hypothetical protein [uncultured Comamonas sp.]
MTKKRIVYTADDGRICVITPAPGFDIAEVAAKDVPQGIAFEIVDVEEVGLDTVPTYPKFHGNAKLDLFTPAEQLAVVTATMTDPVVKLMYDRLLSAAFLTYEDPETERGLQLLVAKELLTQERKLEIVSVMEAA